MPGMHLGQSGIIYSACGPFTKNKESKERIQNFKETGDSTYIHQDELDKSCFQHGMAYGDFKNLPGLIVSVRALRDEALNITENSEYDRYQRDLPLKIRS